MTAPPPPAGGNDKTTLFGVLGIIFALCCPIVGIIFAILSMNQAKKFGTSQALGVTGLVIAGVNILLNVVGFSAGWWGF